MKRLDEFIEKMNIKEKNQIVKRHYENLYVLVRDTLNELNFNAMLGKEDAIKIKKVVYDIQKQALEKIELWDERFDDYYKQALKGKLNTSKLYKITLK